MTSLDITLLDVTPRTQHNVHPIATERRRPSQINRLTGFEDTRNTMRSPTLIFFLFGLLVVFPILSDGLSLGNDATSSMSSRSMSRRELFISTAAASVSVASLVLSSPTPAWAVADCFQDCLKECKKVAPKDVSDWRLDVCGCVRDIGQTSNQSDIFCFASLRQPFAKNSLLIHLTTQQQYIAVCT